VSEDACPRKAQMMLKDDVEGTDEVDSAPTIYRRRDVNMVLSSVFSLSRAHAFTLCAHAHAHAHAPA